MKDGNRHGAPDEKEEMEVKGQEEGGEEQNDLSHFSLLKFVCARVHVFCVHGVWSLHICVCLISHV